MNYFYTFIDAEGKIIIIYYAGFYNDLNQNMGVLMHIQ